MRLKLPDWDFWNTFPDAEIYLVGGALRDLLLNRPVKDYDFVVRKIPLNDLIKRLAKLGQANLVGKKFGVIKFKPDADTQIYDIALPREEFSNSFSGSYRDFTVHSQETLDITHDLARRDFTINAMAYEIHTQQFYDPFNGLHDLQTKTIRTVGSATIRFQEDYSRILRAIRFSCQLNFTIQSQTQTAISALAQHLQDQLNGEFVVPRPIISQELSKALLANPTQCLKHLSTLQILPILIPELSDTKPTFSALEQFTLPAYRLYTEQAPSLLAILGVIFASLLPPKSAKICQNLMLPACQELIWMLKNQQFGLKPFKMVEFENIFCSPHRSGLDLWQMIIALDLSTKNTNRLDILKNALKKCPLPPPLLNGQEIMQHLDLTPGPKIKEILNDIREKQLTGIITTKVQALELLKSYP